MKIVRAILVLAILFFTTQSYSQSNIKSGMIGVKPKGISIGPCTSGSCFAIEDSEIGSADRLLFIKNPSTTPLDRFIEVGDLFSNIPSQISFKDTGGTGFFLEGTYAVGFKTADQLLWTFASYDGDPAIHGRVNMNISIGGPKDITIAPGTPWLIGVEPKVTGSVKIGFNTNDTTRSYLRLDTLGPNVAGPPPAGECVDPGGMIVSDKYTATAEYRLWICTTISAGVFGWKYVDLLTP